MRQLSFLLGQDLRTQNKEKMTAAGIGGLLGSIPGENRGAVDGRQCSRSSRLTLASHATVAPWIDLAFTFTFTFTLESEEFEKSEKVGAAGM